MEQTKQYEYIDLGLPSGLKWAKCNVGAKKETDYGDYFMWGSTTPDNDTTCNWSNAPFNNGSSSYNETHFNSVKNTVCPNDVLAKGYDAAYKTTEGIARIPTEADFQELIDYTANEWTRVSGVNGYKFTSKTDASKYIFIPAAGNCYDGSVTNVGSLGNVWSSSLVTSGPSRALYLSFNSSNCDVYNNSRYYGQSVRPVKNVPK